MRASRLLPAVLLIATAACGGSDSVPRPHVLLVTIDTLRADHLGCYGYDRPTSPVLDGLAAEGVLFERAFCAMPTTVPSHASIFTGTWPLVHGATSNFLDLDEQANLGYLPRELASAGYQASAFVSMGPLATTFEPLGGFEEIDRPEGHDRSSEEVVDAALAWLDRRDQRRPYFLWLHLWDPHTPYRHHPDLMPRFREDFVDDVEPRYGFAPDHYGADDLAKMVDLYDNEIAHVDRELGRLLAGLEARGLGAETLLVVTSDHGESLDELYESEGYAFDHGEFLYDHQLQVPLIVRAPRALRFAAGTRVARPTALTDLTPTILDACGIDAPFCMHGRSRLDDLRGRPTAGQQSVFVQRRIAGRQSRHPFLLGDLVGVRGPGKKLLRNTTTGVEELHANGREDRLNPLADAGAIAGLGAELDAWLEELRPVRSRGGARVAPATSSELQALGYTGEQPEDEAELEGEPPEDPSGSPRSAGDGGR